MTEKMALDDGKCRSQRKQWLAALAAILPMVSAGFLKMFINGQISGALIIGCVIGTLSGAVSADMFGRKRTLLATTISMAAGILGLSLPRPDSSPFPPFFGGINVGIAFTVVPLYISEIADDEIRGRLLMLQVVGIYLGQFMMIIIAGYMIDPIMYVALIVIPIIFLIAIYWFPESPYYLASKKQHEAAVNSLAFFRGIDQVTAAEEVQVVVNYVEENSSQEEICQKVLGIFRGNNLKGLIIVALLIILQWDRMFLYERDVQWDRLFLYDRDNVPHALQTIISIWSIHTEMIVSATRLIWSGILVLTIDTIGRKRYLLGSTIGGCAVMSTAAVILYASGFRMYSRAVSVEQIVTIFVAEIILYLCQIVIFAVHLVFIGELFPTTVKNVATSIAVIFGIMVKFIFLSINDNVPEKSIFDFWAFSPIYLLAFPLIWAFVPETKKNTFSEIQNRLTNIRLTCRRESPSKYNELIDSK